MTLLSRFAPPRPTVVVPVLDNDATPTADQMPPEVAVAPIWESPGASSTPRFACTAN